MPMTSILAFILLTIQAVACPTNPPDSYVSAGEKAKRAFHNSEKTVSIVVTCDDRISATSAKDGLKLLGDLHQVRPNLAYVEIKNEAIRIYSTLGKNPVQVAVVARNASAMKSANDDVIKYLTDEAQ